jgi:curved DNA-binding protein CbpA
MPRDPYRVLEVSPGASSEELHDAYRRLVKLHHPDRNGGSEESARRFKEIQEAYEEVRSRRPRPAPTHRFTDAADSVKERMATLERELREAQAARERARNAAREAARDGADEPAPVTTEDSFGKILGDIRDELADRIEDGRKHPAAQRVSELIDDVVSRLERR